MMTASRDFRALRPTRSTASMTIATTAGLRPKTARPQCDVAVDHVNPAERHQGEHAGSTNKCQRPGRRACGATASRYRSRAAAPRDRAADDNSSARAGTAPRDPAPLLDQDRCIIAIWPAGRRSSGAPPGPRLGKPQQSSLRVCGAHHPDFAQRERPGCRLRVLPRSCGRPQAAVSGSEAADGFQLCTSFRRCRHQV